jgi:hypothetical protein
MEASPNWFQAQNHQDFVCNKQVLHSEHLITEQIRTLFSSKNCLDHSLLVWYSEPSICKDLPFLAATFYLPFHFPTGIRMPTEFQLQLIVHSLTPINNFHCKSFFSVINDYLTEAGQVGLINVNSRPNKLPTRPGHSRITMHPGWIKCYLRTCFGHIWKPDFCFRYSNGWYHSKSIFSP